MHINTIAFKITTTPLHDQQPKILRQNNRRQTTKQYLTSVQNDLIRSVIATRRLQFTTVPKPGYNAPSHETNNKKHISDMNGEYNFHLSTHEQFDKMNSITLNSFLSRNFYKSNLIPSRAQQRKNQVL